MKQTQKNTVKTNRKISTFSLQKTKLKRVFLFVLFYFFSGCQDKNVPFHMMKYDKMHIFREDKSHVNSS